MEMIKQKWSEINNIKPGDMVLAYCSGSCSYVYGQFVEELGPVGQYDHCIVIKGDAEQFNSRFILGKQFDSNYAVRVRQASIKTGAAAAERAEALKKACAALEKAFVD